MRRCVVISSALAAVGACVFALATYLAIRPLPSSLHAVTFAVRKPQIVDRMGRPLSVTYQNGLNVTDIVPLREIPGAMRRAVVLSEDHRFYEHGGIDWRARLGALRQNLRAGRTVRGASTITEQVVRILHPRPRTLWSRWIEGWEARALERSATKDEILEFYLNQVPYAGRRRGVLQGARYYFQRGLDTLTGKEMLALAVMVRSPGRYRPESAAVERGVARLARLLVDEGTGDEDDLTGGRLVMTKEPELMAPTHFVRFVQHRHGSDAAASPVIRTTLDMQIQRQVELLLRSRIRDLRDRSVTDGAALVVDNSDGSIVAWANSEHAKGEGRADDYDAILTPRQPGSTLKPFLYALALEKGWNAGTVIPDEPLTEAVGSGLHQFRNYSRVFYGPIRLRLALGNSLNTPAVRTLQYIGRDAFYGHLHRLGFQSLGETPEHYGDGLALGNGEVTLFELVRAYTALAHQGVWRDLRSCVTCEPRAPARRVFSPTTTTLIGDILSDPEARRLEFGRSGVLRFPVQTAVKTGTSTGYHDAWSVGYSRRYTAGIWLGNLDRQPMQEVSGAMGPALLLRSIFNVLERHAEPRALARSGELVAHRICAVSGARAGANCPGVTEWFTHGSAPNETCGGAPRHDHGVTEVVAPQIVMPTPGLQVARDPRIPDRFESLRFEIESSVPPVEVAWFVDGTEFARGKESLIAWPLVPGRHELYAEILTETGARVRTELVGFRVK